MPDSAFSIVTDASYDLPAEPILDVPLWSETYLWCAWDPAHQIGVYLHQGTAFFDQTVWRSTLTCCLPDGRMVIAKHYGRSTPTQSTGCEALGVTFDEPLRRWTVKLDGACQVVTRDTNRTRLATDGVPSGAKIELTFEATKDLLNHGAVHWGHLHHNQHCWVKGRMQVAGDELHFDGPGYKDHSRGPRDLSEYVGSDFIWAAFPSGTTVVAADIFFRTSDYDKKYCLVNRDGEYRQAEIVSMPALTEAVLDPTAVLFQIDEGQGPVEITGEIHQAINFTHKLPGTELCLGTDLTTNSPTDMAVIDCWTAYTWDKEVGHGLCEWITPINRPRPGKSPIPPLLEIPVFRW